MVGYLGFVFAVVVAHIADPGHCIQAKEGPSVCRFEVNGQVAPRACGGAHVIGVDRGDPDLDPTGPTQHERHIVLDNFLQFINLA